MKIKLLCFRPSRFFIKFTTTSTPAQPTPSSVEIRNEFSPSVLDVQSFGFDDSFQQLFKCNFNQNTNDCKVKFSGKDWILSRYRYRQRICAWYLKLERSRLFTSTYSLEEVQHFFGHLCYSLSIQPIRPVLTTQRFAYLCSQCLLV